MLSMNYFVGQPRSGLSAPHVVQFEDIRSGERFGDSVHVNRTAAEAYAVTALTALGEDLEEARAATEFAGWVCANAQHYGVRIYPRPR